MAKKTKRKQKFYPSKYRHLNSKTPREVWAAEFLSRNDVFLGIVSEWEGVEKDQSLFDHEIVHHFFRDEFNVEFFDPREKAKNIKSKKRRHQRLSSGMKFSVSFSPVVDSLLVTDNESMKKVVNVSFGKEVFQDLFWEQGKSPQRKQYEQKMRDVFHPNSFLLLSINLGRSPKEIIKALDGLKATVRSLIRSKEDPENIDKWKYYLIIYDLKKAGYLNREIRAIFETHYSAIEEVDSDYNIRNYRKKATDLINGDYKKYI